MAFTEKIRKIIFLIGSGTILGLALYGFLIEPNRLVIRHISVNHPSLNRLLAGKTAVHLSDLHIDRLGRREKRILNAIERLDPDFIFLTGDLVQRKADYDGTLSFLAALRARQGIYGVLGDTDYHNRRKSCLFCHASSRGERTMLHQVRFLRQSAARITTARGDLVVYGVDPKAFRPLPPVIDPKAFAGQSPRIVLTHSPLFFDEIDDQKDALLLAGDTHGGQIPLPTRVWSWIGYEKNAKYNRGLFARGRKTMVVSQGTGTSHLHFRLLRPPQLVVLHF